MILAFGHDGIRDEQATTGITSRSRERLHGSVN